MRRYIRCLGAAIGLAVRVVGCLPAAAEQPAQPTAASAATVRKFSLNLKETPLRESLRTYLKGSPIRYDNKGAGTEGFLIFDPNVPDPKLTVSFRDVPFRLGMLLIMGAAREAAPGVSYVKESSNYVVKYSPEWAEQEREAARKAVGRKSEQFVATPLREAVMRWMENRRGRAILANDVPNVPITLQLDDLEVAEGLERIVAEARRQVPGYRLSRGGRTFLIHL